MVFDNDSHKQPGKRPASDKEDSLSESKRQQTEQSILEIADTRITPGKRNTQSKAHCPASVICARTKVLAKRVIACTDGSETKWLVEHVSGQLSLIKLDANCLPTTTTLVASDVVYAWWIDQNTIGVVAKCCLENGIFLYAIDCTSNINLSNYFCESKSAITRLDCEDKDKEQQVCRKSLFLESAISGPMLAKGDSLVCAMPNGFLRVWRINRDISGKRYVSATCDQICLSIVLKGDQEKVVIDLKWTSESVGMGATRTRAFWFTLATSGSPASVVECQGYNRLLSGMASWRWGGSVVATAKGCRRTLPPKDAMLCLPSPTGMSFYLLDKIEQSSIPVYSFSFPRGWVWLCGSDSAFVLLSPCRKKATVCRMPSGRSIYTLNVDQQHCNSQELIQDAWMAGSQSTGCAISTGTAIYAVSWKN
ncbi:hypothetical protein J3B02_002795 [Coemansia erecta]|nr:hypothetical protein J3B02_002795 [Coemansia erecta]KAJ2877360.1 hypothetical protein FB639_003798 [Coemansia asiatica]